MSGHHRTADSLQGQREKRNRLGNRGRTFAKSDLARLHEGAGISFQRDFGLERSDEAPTSVQDLIANDFGGRSVFVERRQQTETDRPDCVTAHNERLQPPKTHVVRGEEFVSMGYTEETHLVFARFGDELAGDKDEECGGEE